MKNNKKTGADSPARDRQRVAGEQDWEVSYVSDKLGVPKKEVEAAIKKVGNSRDKVEEYIRQRNGK